jgi:hypothetical protein
LESTAATWDLSRPSPGLLALINRMILTAESDSNDGVQEALCHIPMDMHQQVMDAAGPPGTALGARDPVL